jgi:hypothetical protein
VIDAALPFNQDDVGILRALQGDLLRRARDEVGDHRVHRDPPPLEHDPRLAGRHEPRAESAPVEPPHELELCGHFPDVAVRAHRQHYVRVEQPGPSRRDGQARRGAPDVRYGPPGRPRTGGEHGIGAEKRVQPGEQIAAGVERLGQPPMPLGGKPPPHRSYADEDSVRTEGEPLLHRRHYRDAATEPQNILDDCAGMLPIEHAQDALRLIPDDGVGRLRAHRAEVAVGDDEVSPVSHAARYERGFTAGSRKAWRNSVPPW